MPKNPISLAGLRRANIRRNKEWDPDQKLGAAFRATELAGEVGEVCNIVKKLERERLGLRGSRTGLVPLEEECADVLICLDLLAMHYGLDLEAALVRKFNATSDKLGLTVFLNED